LAFSPFRNRTAPRPPVRSVPVMAVGQRVFVNCPGIVSATVLLGDESGKVESTTRVVDGTEVEVLAWRPRGASGTRYRVRVSSDGADGWLAAENLRKSLAPAPETSPVAPPTSGDDDDVRPFGQRSLPARSPAPVSAPAAPPSAASVTADSAGRRFGQRF